ncbi:MAG TPA: hypothetical protein VE439_10225 [Anaerolineae bacterium]|nr:hypothetical protein [Anaerolineae bacterium]
MSAVVLHKEFEELTKKAHMIEDKMRKPDTGCMTPEIDHLREELIDVTLRMDEIKEETGEHIEVKY